MTAQVTEVAGMAFREVSVNEIREVLRVWLGVAGLPAPGYRTIAAYCGLDRKTVRRTSRPPRPPVCAATTTWARSMTR
ncbi:hypothetical protein [Mycolicibacterium agri]|uniref:hypothetical protein n=1 Tax=Mycolicibacterium agri TaxID=36811 RepID=UPI003FCE2182